MSRKQKLTSNLILGIIVGIGVVEIIISQIKLVSSLLNSENIKYNYNLLKYGGFLISGVVFLIIVKKFARARSKKLAYYFVLSIVMAAFGALLGWFFIMVAVGQILDVSQVQTQQFLETDKGIFITMNFTYIILFILITIFVIIFMILINRKIKYISEISSGVRQIEEEGFGLQIKEKGNDELTELCMGINSMSYKLKEKIDYEKKIEKEKNELITNVSHDLRTPLTSVIGYVELLRLNGFQDKDKFDEYIEVVERRVTGLNELINELFEYTKLNSTQQLLDCRKIDIIPMIKHLVQEYRVVYERVGLGLIDDIQVRECIVEVDESKIARVIQNLLDNSKKYTRENSDVVIVVYTENNTLNFVIENDIIVGTNLEVENLFERFYKADVARSESDSSGLGLAIVKRIIELHGGELTATLKDNRIRFEVKLRCSSYKD